MARWYGGRPSRVNGETVAIVVGFVALAGAILCVALHDRGRLVAGPDWTADGVVAGLSYTPAQDDLRMVPTPQPDGSIVLVPTTDHTPPRYEIRADVDGERFGWGVEPAVYARFAVGDRVRVTVADAWREYRDGRREFAGHTLRSIEAVR
jgi:hypothetical protein